MKRELLTAKQIKHEIENFLVDKYELDDDGFVHSLNTQKFILPGYFLTFLPDSGLCYINVNFKIAIDFICVNKLITLEGSPLFVMNSFQITNSEITSLKGICQEANSISFSSNPKLTSLKDVHKYVKKCKFFSFDGYYVESHILGLLLIPDLQAIHCGPSSVWQPNQCSRAISILNNYVKRRKTQDNVDLFDDVLNCQQELIDSGLKSFAQL